MLVELLTFQLLWPEYLAGRTEEKGFYFVMFSKGSAQVDLAPCFWPCWEAWHHCIGGVWRSFFRKVEHKEKGVPGPVTVSFFSLFSPLHLPILKLCALESSRLNGEERQSRWFQFSSFGSRLLQLREDFWGSIDIWNWLLTLLRSAIGILTLLIAFSGVGIV